MSREPSATAPTLRIDTHAPQTRQRSRPPRGFKQDRDRCTSEPPPEEAPPRMSSSVPPVAAPPPIDPAGVPAPALKKRRGSTYTGPPVARIKGLEHRQPASMVGIGWRSTAPRPLCEDGFPLPAQHMPPPDGVPQRWIVCTAYGREPHKHRKDRLGKPRTYESYERQFEEVIDWEWKRDRTDGGSNGLMDDARTHRHLLF